MRSLLIKSTVVLAALGLTLAQTKDGISQDSYPTRTIRIIVPLPPGGAPDAVTRVIAQKLAAKWSQPVLVENRPGFVQNMGAAAVAKAEPDGYTLLSTAPAPLVTNQFLQSDLNYDARAFVPVTVTVKFPFILLTHARSPFTTLDELIVFAKARAFPFHVGSYPHDVKKFRAS